MDLGESVKLYRDHGQEAAYPGFFIDDNAISTFSKDECVPPYIARQEDTRFNQGP